MAVVASRWRGGDRVSGCTRVLWLLPTCCLLTNTPTPRRWPRETESSSQPAEAPRKTQSVASNKIRGAKVTRTQTAVRCKTGGTGDPKVCPSQLPLRTASLGACSLWP
jgi:hypothetical protein